MSSEASNRCNRDQLLGIFKANITNLQEGLKRAEELLERTTKALETHSSNAEVRMDDICLELETIRTILKSQTDRVTELMQVTSENTQWLYENSSIGAMVEDHETRITDLEHNRTFLRGVVWLAGIAFAFFTATPILKKLIEWIGSK